MGNCLETCIESQEVEREQEKQEEREEKEDGFVKESGVRIKIVLTKEELEWLMFEIKEKRGKRLEDVLEEIEKERRKERVVVWKPALESIMESPEVVEMDR
ncbi:Deoxyhypusine synthase [Actinidia chinensis var. chinensis]|uniref:Deoxyhypusine synthase n=1 Tax=Actinidia chinensis var. chinensis TaxID=1590841 RepID=A0A2R6QMZ9_ACTCC|nr:Deoxyhypusine synthase [Actinidia chinensis var. chinensis]